MKAMLLAAGRGLRLGALTAERPKPLLEVGGRPLIEHHLMALKRAGFTELVINLGWRGAAIRERLGDGADFGVTIVYSEEPENEPLETGGGIHRALPLLGTGPFAVVNSDLWCDYPLHHLRWIKPPLAHLILVANPAHHPAGDFVLRGGYVTMPGTTPENTPEKTEPTLTYAGIAVLHPELFAGCEPGRYRLAPLLAAAARRGQVTGSEHHGLWIDIGTPERLAAARRAEESNGI